MLLTSLQISNIARCSSEVASMWLEPLSDAMNEFNIVTSCRKAAFMAQIVHESAGLVVLVENLRYSAGRLAVVWPRHFYLPPDEPLDRHDANEYAFRPEATANLVYSGRMGNGPPHSGDGWRFRGRGLMQLTGRKSYASAADALKVDLLQYPEFLLEPSHAARSAAWYWSTCGANELADDGTEESFKKISVAINGGTLGLGERMDIWTHARTIFRDGS